VCFIEPADALPAACYVTPIAECNRELYATDFGKLSDVPTHAVTYGLQTLMRARELCLVVVGAKKAKILAQALNGPVTTQCPASLLQLHPHILVCLDQAAATEWLAQCNVRGTLAMIAHPEPQPSNFTAVEHDRQSYDVA
jgi:glucosamine-6-phosphate deaminase